MLQLSLWLFLISCENTHHKGEALIENFQNIPEEIDGCACLFSENSTAFRNKQYLYADNMQDIAVIAVDGNILKLALIQDQLSSDNSFVSKASGDALDVELDVRKSEQLDEVGVYFGTLEVKTREGKIIKKTVFGECGC